MNKDVPLIPDHPLLDAIDSAIKSDIQAQPLRGHLGMSQIGKHDERALWLNFRWCLPPTHSPRVERIFRLGDAIEDELARFLRMIPGFQLHTNSPDGTQFRFSLFGGHFAGSMDGACVGVPGAEKTWHVWEAKSVAKKRFTDLQGKGVKEWSPEYYAQMQCYMGMSGMERALFTAYCKDDSEIYSERVRFDEMEWAALQAKALRILESPEPPKSAFPSRDWYEAKWMDAVESAIYWGDRVPPLVNCRNCRFSTPDLASDGAKWICGLSESEIPAEFVKKGCECHQFIPALIPGKIKQLTDSSIIYTLADGQELINDNGESGWTSKEIAELSKVNFTCMNDEFMQTMRRDMGAKIEYLQDPLSENDDIPF